MNASTGLSPRSYIIEEYTKTVCPSCFADRQRRSDEDGVFVDGMLVAENGSIWLRRFCPVHGETQSLYEEDAEIWRARRGWSTPTLSIVPDRADNVAGFPDGYRQGLPASHGQHTCILLLNVTEHCNFKCPTCFASALDPGTAKETDLPSKDDIVNTVKTVLEREGGKIGVVMLSGGEPTIRKDLPEIIEEIAALNVTRVLINTNGRRIARDDRFLEFLTRMRKRVEIYLQFDGLTPSVHETLRAEDLSAEKQEIVKRLNDASVFFTLVMTVSRGVNEYQVGDVLQFGMEMPRCSGVAVQPVFGSGRNPGFDPMSRSTPTGVLKRLHEQTQGKMKADDFIPLPCSHRDCCDIGYYIRGVKGKWSSLTDMVGRDELKRWIHLVSNTIVFDNASSTIKEMVKDGTLQRVFSEQQKVSSLSLARDLFKMCACIPELPELLELHRISKMSEEDQLEKLAERTFRVTVKMFMDANTFHEARIRQCCVHTGSFEDDPRRYSFCWRWLFADASDFPTGLKNRNMQLLEVRG